MSEAKIKKTVVILSGFIREGVADKITSLDYDYKRKVLTGLLQICADAQDGV